MGFVDRINAAFLRRIRAKQAIEATARSAAFLDSLPNVTRLVALMHPGFIGETMVLLAELEDGHFRWIDEHDEHWHDALAALDRDRRSVTTSTCWTLQLMGDETRTPIELFVR